jgi:hypothetical protein
MKTIKLLFLSLAITLGFTACDPDGDTLTTTGAETLTLSGSGDVVLDANNLSALALTLNWTDNSTITLNTPSVQAPRYATTNTVQFSASADFANVIEQLADDGATSMQFTVEALNSIAGRIGIESGVSSPVYIRISSVLAANMPTQYSNVYQINITPYTIDMTRGYILNANKEDTGWILGSPESNGIYSGFLGVTGWFNYWLQEGTGILWGNDGVSGTPFLISSEDSHWNFWYPGPEGCYYTIVNTQRQEWSALHVSSLNVSGDVVGEMIYTRKENKWTLTFDASKSGAATIRISGNGEQYNVNTGTDDAAAIATTVAFGGQSDKLTFGTDAQDIAIQIPATGEVTLTLYLSDPMAWTCSVEAGGAATGPSAATELWAVGIDDGISGGWNFDQWIPLTNEDDLTYAGVCQINSLWGYRLYPEKDNWDGAYGCDWGDAAAGGLVQGTENNIPGADPGLYLLEASLSAMTYQTTAVESVSITGIGDNWDLLPLQATDEAGVYTIDLEVTASTPWGYQIILNGNWDMKFGGTADQLIYKGDNIALDDSYIGSTWTFTVNLCKGTITISE